MGPHRSAHALIREFAAVAGIDGIAVCDAAPLNEARKSLEQAIGSGCIPHEVAPRRETISRLTDPAMHLKGARSVVVAYESYYNDEPVPDDPECGSIAAYTRSNFYHDLRRRLLNLADFMEREFRCRAKTFSCYVALTEKPLAQRAGLGYYGKNGVIVTPNHGSLVVLGEVITDLEIEPDVPMEADCGSCTRCIDACPTGAIRSPYVVDRNLCIQYISERKGTVPPRIRDLWQNRLYGCSTCLDVCPLNKGLTATGRRVTHGEVGSSVPLAEVLLIDERRFSTQFGDNQIGMRDINAIRRNAVIAAGNSGSARLADCLPACLKDPDPEIRLHAAWALARLIGGSAKMPLEGALRAERDDSVKTGIKSLLDGIGGLI